ncbi:Protein of unknown function [Gryllus bimaculatus]|nr:Protein of unknown function [Gryllus bimaculatus]
MNDSDNFAGSEKANKNCAYGSESGSDDTNRNCLFIPAGNGLAALQIPSKGSSQTAGKIHQLLGSNWPQLVTLQGFMKATISQ